MRVRDQAARGTIFRATLNNLSQGGRHWYVSKWLWWVVCSSRKLSSDPKIPSGSVFLSFWTMKFLNVNYACSNSNYLLINNINYRLDWLDVACDWVKPEQTNLFLWNKTPKGKACLSRLVFHMKLHQFLFIWVAPMELIQSNAFCGVPVKVRSESGPQSPGRS